MPRSPLTESIQKVRRLVTEIQGTLTVDEFNLLLDELIPEPEPEVKQAKKTTARKIERCEACNYTRRALQHVNPQHVDYHEFVEPQKASKKSSKSQQSSSKSPRASGIHAQLQERRQEQRETTKNNDNLCQYEYDGSSVPCCFPADANVHHLTSDPNYHPFVSTAPPAPVSSPANGAASATERNTRRSAPPSTPETYDERGQTASLSTVGSGTQPEDVGTVAHGASGGRVQG